MRAPLAAIAFLLVAAPVAGEPQEVPGLDLSQPPRPEKDAEEMPPMDLSQPPPPPKGEAARAAERPGEFRPFSEEDVALGDRVKAVQRKGFLKKGRFEVAPVFSLTVNDAFFQKFGYGLRLAYNLHDAFAVAVRATGYSKYRTDNVREGKIAFNSQLLESDIEGQLMLGGVWSPVYGKASILADSIVHFDLFLAAGFGLVWTATSNEPLEQGVDVGFGPPIGWPPFGDRKPAKLAAEVGGGVRFYPKEWLALEVGLLATLYPDQPAPLLPATVQKVFAANVGVSFFWPTTFEYVHP